MSKEQPNEDEAVTFTWKDTETGQTGTGIATGDSVEDIAQQLDRFSRGGDKEVINPQIKD